MLAVNEVPERTLPGSVRPKPVTLASAITPSGYTRGEAEFLNPRMFNRRGTLGSFVAIEISADDSAHPT